MSSALLPDLNAKQVPPGLILGLAERARQEGLDGDALLARAGLAKDQLLAGERCSYRAMIRLLAAIEQTEHSPELFLSNGAQFEFTDYGILGYAMMSAATMGQAIQIAMRYHRTAGPLVHIAFQQDEHTAFIRLDNAFDLPPNLLRSVVENLISTFPPLIEQLTGLSGQADRLLLAYPAPEQSAAYAEIFGCQPEFDAAATLYGVPVEVLQRPVLRADADAARLLERSCQELLREIERQDTLANRIRQRLLATPGSSLTAGQAAMFLHISERTLRRQLQDEGTSFQEVLDDVRTRMAKDYLASTTLSLQQIAELIGFTEATNFRRAFLRWTGTSPYRFRHEHPSGT